AGEARAVGEASHESLYRPRAVENIRRHIPGARFIAVLRDPADRAYSHFMHLVRNGTEPLADFEAALAAERRGDLGDGFP
ncbi:sulfotransferase, partial [Escherichia coli]|nr:sulfotransferase [Escherichia coli]